MRTRKQFVREKVQHVQRIQKTREDANLKIASVISDVIGASGRALLEALIAGETRPEALLAVTRPSPFQCCLSSHGDGLAWFGPRRCADVRC